METFKIGNHTYSINSHEVLLGDQKEPVWGKCEVGDKSLHVSSGELKNKSAYNEILIHEALHAMLYESGYQFPDAETEEGVVYHLGKIMHGFLQDNIDALNEMYDHRPEVDWLRLDIGDKLRGGKLKGNQPAYVGDPNYMDIHDGTVLIDSEKLAATLAEQFGAPRKSQHPNTPGDDCCDAVVHETKREGEKQNGKKRSDQ